MELLGFTASGVLTSLGFALLCCGATKLGEIQNGNSPNIYRTCTIFFFFGYWSTWISLLTLTLGVLVLTME